MKKNLIINLALLVPPALFWITADKYYIYVPAILGIIGFALAWIIRIIISKLKQTNRPSAI